MTVTSEQRYGEFVVVRRHEGQGHVAELVLRVVGDPDASLAVLEPDPLVIRGVPEVVGDLHAPEAI